MRPLVRGDWHDVRALAAGLAKPLATELVDLHSAVGRVLAGDLRSLLDLPSADVSAMDGWVVAGDGPWRVRGHIVNGRRTSDELATGEAMGIGTGAPVPAGVTAIVRREHGTLHDDVLHWSAPGGATPSRRDVRKRGEETRTGEIVLDAGTRLAPVSVAVAAGSGHDAVEVVCVPRVDVLVTGDEVALHGLPGEGRVRDSVGPLMSGMTRAAGGAAGPVRVLEDDLQSLASAIESSTADIVITTGGTAVGEADHMRDALARIGATLVVDTVAVRPGGPTLLAVRADGRLVAALPGNPLAAVVGYLAVVAPVLTAMTSRRPRPPRAEVIGVDVEPFGGATRVVPYVLRDRVAIPSGKGSPSMLRGLAAADGLLVLPRGGARAGDRVGVAEPLWHATS